MRTVLSLSVAALLSATAATAAPPLEVLVPPGVDDVDTPRANSTVCVDLSADPTASSCCTGTLIRPDLVVTAAHCTNASFDGEGVTPNRWHRMSDLFGGDSGWTIGFGPNRNRFRDQIDVTHVASASGVDMILLALERSVDPAIAVPARVLIENPETIDWSTQTFTVAGWGLTAGGGSPPSRRKTASATNGEYPCDYWGGPIPVPTNLFCAQAQIASGDSGGPLYWTDLFGTRFLIGTLGAGGGGRTVYTSSFGTGGPIPLGQWFESFLDQPNPNDAPLAKSCLNARQPAATLLFPYFEVDLAHPNGASTNITIGNATSGPIVAHAVLWTNLGKATGSFDIAIHRYGTWGMNLRDLFATGRVPPSGPADPNFFDCNASYINGIVYPSVDLVAAHSGEALGDGLCLGKKVGSYPGYAIGYLTVDVVSRCDAAVRFPFDPGYFGPDLHTRVAQNDNNLWGEWSLIDPSTSSVTTLPAVSIVADPERFDVPGPKRTFYGKFVGGFGTDARQPLPSHWSARYPLPDGDGVDVVGWRDAPVGDRSGVSCTTWPADFPLTRRTTYLYDEASGALRSDPNGDVLVRATGRSAVAVFGTRTLPWNFGSIELQLDPKAEGLIGDTSAQAWLGWLAAPLGGRGLIGVPGIALNDLCAEDPTP